MKIKTIMILFLLSFSVSVTASSDVSTIKTLDNLPVTVIDLNSEIPTYYAVDIPWFEQETPGSCGAASLRTAFGQLGYSLDEGELRIAAQTTSTTTLTGDMIRAAHFSNASKEGGEPAIQGYTEKPFGTDSYEIGFNGYSPSGQTAADEFLKQRLLEGRPVILLMSYRSSSSSGHFRVLRGYDDRTGRYVFTDSLGANPESGSHWTVASASLYENYWDYSGYWAQIICPWSVSLTPVQNPSPGGVFQLDAIIDSGVPGSNRNTPWSLHNSSIRLELPIGYSFTSGDEETVFGFNSSGIAQVSWQIQAPPTIENTDWITAGVTGWINGSGTHPWQVKPFDYCDVVYTEERLNLVDWTPPEMIDLSVSSDDDGVLLVNASLTDDTPVQNVSLQWRMTATNWTTISMQHIEGTVWQTSGIVPLNPSGNEIIQLRVLADDDFGNLFKSTIYECDYTYTTLTITTPTTTTTGTEPTSSVPTGDIVLEVAIIVTICIMALIIVVIYRQRINA